MRGLRQTWRLAPLGFCFLMLLCGCGRADAAERITNRGIPIEDVTEFWYTKENINFDASYQRYRFYTEDGQYQFFHETRERPGAYGPATENDVTAVGTIELSADEWREVLRLLKNGTVRDREDSAVSGSSGPWTYLYWKGDKSRYQQFSFADFAEQNAFEDYCRSLSDRTQ